jgi:hypothetical protein
MTHFNRSCRSASQDINRRPTECGVLPWAKYLHNNSALLRAVTIFCYTMLLTHYFVLSEYVYLFFKRVLCLTATNSTYNIDFVCPDITDLLTAAQILICFPSVWSGLNPPLQGVKVTTTRTRLCPARLWIQKYVQSFSLWCAENGIDFTTEYITGQRQFLVVDYLYYSEKKGKI